MWEEEMCGMEVIWPMLESWDVPWNNLRFRETLKYLEKMHEMGISHRNKEWLDVKMTLEELQKL